MSHGAQSLSDDVELNLSLPGGLRVCVRAPASAISAASELLAYIAEFPGTGPAVSEASFELVPPGPTTSSGQSSQPAILETRDQIARSFSPCPSRLLQCASKLCGSATSGTDRVRRAWLAGKWAGAVAAGRITTPSRAHPIDLRPRFYAVLRASGLSEPTIFRSAGSYFRCIGDFDSSDSISHGFPSETEAKIYLEAAGVTDPSLAA